MAKVLPEPTPEKPAIAELLDKVALLPLETSAPKQTCCVTGATGLVGAHVVRRLLRAGHTVHAPVRRPDDEKAVGCLRAMPGAAERLKLFKADLLEPGSYDESMKGCTFRRAESPPMNRGDAAFGRDCLQVRRCTTSRRPSSWSVLKNSYKRSSSTPP